MFIRFLSAFKTGSFDGSLAFSSKEHTKFVSLNNQPCQARSTLADINSSKAPFYSFTVIVNNFDGACNTADAPYTQICVPDKVKNMIVKVFSLMLSVNETRFLVQHESCDCKYGLNESACNSK